MNLHKPEAAEVNVEQCDSRPIRILKLSSRPHKVLMQAGIDTIGKLRLMSDEELLKFPNFGLISLAEARKALSNLWKTEGRLGEEWGRKADTLECKEKAASPRGAEPSMKQTDQLEDAHLMPEKVFQEGGSVVKSTPKRGCKGHLEVQQVHINCSGTQNLTHQVGNSGRFDSESISVLRLSSRPYRVLIKAGINSVGKLRMMSDEELLRLPNFGLISRAETQEALAMIDSEGNPRLDKKRLALETQGKKKQCESIEKTTSANTNADLLEDLISSFFVPGENETPE